MAAANQPVSPTTKKNEKGGIGMSVYGEPNLPIPENESDTMKPAMWRQLKPDEQALFMSSMGDRPNLTKLSMERIADSKEGSMFHDTTTKGGRRTRKSGRRHKKMTHKKGGYIAHKKGRKSRKSSRSSSKSSSKSKTRSSRSKSSR